MSTIPKGHPRYASLLRRERLVEGWRKGLAVPQGLIAHGRGEAFDYLLGEQTQPFAGRAIAAAARALTGAAHPVLAINGNVASLCPEAVAQLASTIPATVEINLFHRTGARSRKLARHLRAAGVTHLVGTRTDARLPGLRGGRASCTRRGLLSADVVLVAVEDGDRTEALRRLGKTVVAVDLNPLSRTARSATITIVDEVTRALPALATEVGRLRRRAKPVTRAQPFDNRRNLSAALRFLRRRLLALAQPARERAP